MCLLKIGFLTISVALGFFPSQSPLINQCKKRNPERLLVGPARKKENPTNSLVLASSPLLGFLILIRYDTVLMNLRVMVWILKSQISITENETGIHDESENHATVSVIFLRGGVED